MKMATDLNHSPSIGVARMGHEGKCGIDRATLIPVHVWWWRCLGFLNEIIYFHYLTVCLFDDKFFYPEACFVFTAWVEKIDTHLMRCFIIVCTWEDLFYQLFAPDKICFNLFAPIRCFYQFFFTSDKIFLSVLCTWEDVHSYHNTNHP